MRETWAHVQYGGLAGAQFKASKPLALNGDGQPLIWLPPIFMPRWASRITLEITAVRVERVQDISIEDAMHEGFDALHIIDGHGPSYRDTFAHFWDSLNAKRGYGWDVNPWVWVISFRRLP